MAVGSSGSSTGASSGSSTGASSGLVDRREQRLVDRREQRLVDRREQLVFDRRGEQRLSSTGASSGSSSGTSSGSSTGGTPTTARLNFINAAADYGSQLDVCVAAHAQTFGSPVFGGTDYTHITTFADVTNDATAILRLVAAGASCMTPLMPDAPRASIFLKAPTTRSSPGMTARTEAVATSV